MVIKSYEKCLREIIDDMEGRKSVDYGDKISVCRFNTLYHRSFKTLQYIENHHNDRINDLLAFLKDSDDVDLIKYCAPMFFRLDKCTKEQKQKALDLIKYILTSEKLDTLDRRGFSMNLEQWEQQIDE